MSMTFFIGVAFGVLANTGLLCLLTSARKFQEILQEKFNSWVSGILSPQEIMKRMTNGNTGSSGKAKDIAAEIATALSPADPREVAGSELERNLFDTDAVDDPAWVVVWPAFPLIWASVELQREMVVHHEVLVSEHFDGSVLRQERLALLVAEDGFEN
mgnify:CR=1 FL=1